MARVLTAKELFPDSKIIQKGGDWEDAFLAWATDINDLLSELPDNDDDRSLLADELSAQLSYLTRFAYLARGERDSAVGKGYEDHPKGQFNSSEQDALARRDASAEDRMRKYIGDLQNAMNMRISALKSRVAFATQQIARGG